MDVIKVVTLNLWGEQPPLDRRMGLAITGLGALDPDVIALQEVRVIPGALANQAETIAGALGLHWCFAPATPWGGGDEGLAILSRYPIDAHAAHELPHARPTERRIVLHATVATPLGPLEAFTTHLNYRLGDGAIREDQVAAVDAHAAAVASELPKLLLGDFNAVPDSDEMRFLRGLHSVGGRRTVWQDAWERRHGRADGFTWASRNPYTARLRWLDQDRRLDYVLVSPLQRDGRGLVRACRIVLDEPAGDGALPSDHFGVYAEVQAVALPAESKDVI